MKKFIYIITALTILSACSADDDLLNPITGEQKSLLGRAVNFNTSIADAFTSRATYNSDGRFNEGDLMTIYRQYSNDNGETFDSENEVYRVYYFKVHRAGNTGIQLKSEWAVKPGQLGSDGKGADIPESRRLFTQTEADSLTWDNGKTVRFRAWSLSNLSGNNENGSNKSFYPDFTISEWVHASGPTLSIPLILRHIGCRMGFSPYLGNEITKVEICLDKEDYMRSDNADSATDDESDSMSEERAQAVAEEVTRVYNSMCMPGGIDLDNYRLKALTKEYYSGGDFKNIISEENQGKMIDFASKTPEEIEQLAQRPLFAGNNGNYYSIAIPHDMSNGTFSGDVIILPPETRFRIYLKDVNNGDGNTSEESKYHIFSLSDIKNGIGEAVFADGMKLYAGYSYMFTVGYHYGQFKVDASTSFSWAQQDLEMGNFSDAVEPQPTSPTPYKWWQDAIDDAINDAIVNNNNFNPKFSLTNEAEFMEFINLVNGTAATNTGELAKTWRSGKINTENGTNYWWYDPANPIDEITGDTVWVTHAIGAERGFIFYKHYFPADGDKAAHYEEDYLRGAYSFYSNIVKRAFTVKLAADIDLKDLKLTAIGKTAATPFQGNFDGQMHTISNMNIPTGYLFEHIDQASVCNLTITGNSRLSLVKEGKKSKIAGVAMTTPAYGGNAIAKALVGTSYVAGCIHYSESVYDTPGALVGSADDLSMFGCMQTSQGITGGALLGSYSGSVPFFAPQSTKEIEWGRFMCNYYDTTESPAANAVGDIADSYAPQEYIRGRKTHILCAVVDNKVSNEVFVILSPEQKKECYGLAPWRAMNYGILQYNVSAAGLTAPCKAHYESITVGYAQYYPRLKAGLPVDGQYENVLKLYN